MYDRITCAARELLALVESLNVALKSLRRLIQLDELSLNLATAEIVNAGSAPTGELLVRLQPSDALRSFALAVLAGEFDGVTIKISAHIEHLRDWLYGGLPGGRLCCRPIDPIQALSGSVFNATRIQRPIWVLRMG